MKRNYLLPALSLLVLVMLLSSCYVGRPYHGYAHSGGYHHHEHHYRY